MKKFFSFFASLFLLVATGFFFGINPVLKADAQFNLNRDNRNFRIPSINVVVEKLTMESFAVKYHINQFDDTERMTIDIFENKTQLATRFVFDASEIQSKGEIIISNDNLGDVQINGFQISPSVEYKVVTTVYLPNDASIFDVQEFTIQPLDVDSNSFALKEYTEDGFIFSLGISNPDSLEGDLFICDTFEMFPAKSLPQKFSNGLNLFQVEGMESGKKYSNLAIVIDDHKYGKIEQDFTIPVKYGLDQLLLFLCSLFLLLILIILILLVAIITQRNHKYNRNVINSFDDDPPNNF